MTDTAPAAMAASIPYDRRFLPPDGQIAFVPFNIERAGHLGLALVYWSVFEQRLFALLADMAAGADRATEFEKTRGFAPRLEMGRKLIGEIRFDRDDVNASALFLEILDRAEEIGGRRNIHVHGDWLLSIQPHSSDATCRISGTRRKGAPVETFDADADSLSKLWHDIAILAANLDRLCRMVGEVEGGYFVINTAGMHAAFVQRDAALGGKSSF
jgi:hypothetical protein